MDPQLQEALLGVLRHLLTAGGGVLVTAGYTTNDQLTAAITAFLGAFSFGIGVAWSWWQKKQAERKKADAVAAAVIRSATVSAQAHT